MDEIGFVEQFKPGAATSVAEVLARASAMPDRDEITEAAAARAAADARAEQRETAAMLNRMAGDPLGNVSRCQAAVSEARERVLDLENQLETARGRLTRASESLAHWSGAADEVMTTARRSSTSDDPLEQAQRRAHQAFAEATRAAWSAAQAGTPRQVSRPFRGGVAVRSHLECVYCLRENVDAETSALLHLDPQHDVPITTAAQAEQAEHAERHGHRSGAEIAR